MVRNMEALRLFKSLMRESQKFDSYNIRHYALRRIRDAFKENKSLSDIDVVAQQLQHGRSSLELIRRQVLIGNIYESNKLIIEKQPNTRAGTG